ncbi:MAG: rod shape-determining protein MreD [Bacteroidaceae bacterium]
MINETLKHIIRFVLLLLLQVLVFNHVHIFDYATPQVCVYLLLCFPLVTSRSLLLLWGFSMGFLIDLFSNTFGLSTIVMTFMAMIQPFLLKAFSPHDDDGDVSPSFSSLGIGSFSRYVITAVLLFEIFYFGLESFSFFNIKDVLLSMAGGTLLSSLMILAIEGIRHSGSTKRKV